MRNRSASVRRAAQAAWCAIALVTAGASNAMAGWRATGPYGGDAELVRAVPQVRDRVIAGAHNGLMFVSNDGAASWKSISFPAQFSGNLHALEVDPRSPDTWFAGVESNNSWSAGVYKTTDGGASWTSLPEMKGISVWSLAIWPGDPNVMAAGTGTGVFLTRDGGSKWTRISPEDDSELRPVVSLAFHPADSKILYAGTTHLPWRTADGGATWQSIHEGMEDDSDVFSIDIDPEKPEHVLSSACSGVYASMNGGELWARSQTPRGAFRTHFVAMMPGHADTVFAGTTLGLLRSLDGGKTWRTLSVQSVKSIAFDAMTPGRIYFASPTGGILLSTDGGNTLHEANFGFTNRNFTTIAGAGNELYSSSVYEPAAGIYRTETQGLRWVHGAGPASDQILSMAAAPDNPLFVMAAGYHSVQESKDGGKTWLPRKVPGAGNRVSSLLMLPGKVVLAATGNGIFRSKDAGLTWVSASDARVELLEGSSKFVSAVGSHGALASSDAGLSWRVCGQPAADTTWYGLDFDKTDGGIALAATATGLFRSTDGCSTWAPAVNGLQAATANLVFFHPTHPGEAFVSQGSKVYCSTDRGENWTQLSEEGLSNSGPSSLFVLPAAPETLFALFPRRGVFSTSIKEKPLQ